ncbi:MAG: HlyD family efflux transporter periplasmic adaptor subunit [Cyclobacteriaceae bacterium]
MRKVLSIAGGAVLLVIGFFLARSLANTEKVQPKQPEVVLQSVFTEKVENTDIPTLVTESGLLMAKNRIELYAEVQGVMERTKKDFKPGSSFKKGETLVSIRNTDYLAGLQAQKSTLQNLVTSILADVRLDFPESYDRWHTYVSEFDINKPIQELPEPASRQEKFYVTSKNIYSTYYSTKNAELVYQKYTLRAPFSGMLTEGLVTPGTLVRQGQKLGELIDPSLYELEIAVGKSVYPYLEVGHQVAVVENDTQRKWTGKIVRINGRVDQSTQTVQVFVELKGKDLKEGMYLQAEVIGKSESNAFELNRSLLIDDREVYVVRDDKLELVEVTPVYFTQESVIVKGLTDGEHVVIKPVAGAFTGMEVQNIAK